MPERHIGRTETFENNLKRLSRKDPEFPNVVAEFLDAAVRQDVPSGTLVRGFGGEPIYKVRLPLGGKGKRGGARLIYWHAPDHIVAISAYAKSDREDMTASQIRNALSTLPELPGAGA